MPATSSVSNGTPFSPIQISASESARHTPSPTESERQALVKLVDALQAAALNPAILNNLGSLILHKEHDPCARSLAMLLHPLDEPGADVSCENPANLQPSAAKKTEPRSLSTERTARPADISRSGDAAHADRRKAHPQSRMDAAFTLWKRHVPYASPPRSLIEFAVDYLDEHPGTNMPDFFLPFKQLAQRGIPIPEDIALVFTHEVLPFDTFRGIVQTYVTRLPIQMPGLFNLPAARNVWTDAIYWEHALAALCAPFPMSLLKEGEITREMLLDWTGLKARKKGLSLDQTTQDKELPAPSEISEPITVLLANLRLLNGYKLNRSTTSSAALLKNPEKLRFLADNLVPRPHIVYFLSILDSVGWSVLEQEMDRVAGLHKTLNAGKSAEERAFFYSDEFRPQRPEENTYLVESRHNMAPYLLINTLRADERLDTWIVAKASDGDRHAEARLERRPASALFEEWTLKGIPVQRQALMGRLMAKGFDQTWAQKVVEDHADDLSRVQAWAGTRAADLHFRLDGAMTAAMARWLDDKSIPSDMLSLVPAMVESDMEVEQIDQILGMRFKFVQGVFGSPDTPEKIRYGLSTPAQLLHRALHGNEADDETRKAEEQQLADVSELRETAAETRDKLRHMLRAVETLRAGMKADTSQARQCDCLADAWKKAIALLGHVLQPRTDAHWAQEYRQINDKLTTLVANLSFGITAFAEPVGAGAAELHEFV